MLLSAGAVALTAWHLALSITDVIFVKRERLNGAVQFMTWDNARHHGMLLFLSCLMVWRAFLPFASTSLFIGYCIVAVIITDAVFTFRRRTRMAELVGEYMGRRGGRRKLDPPAD